MILCLGQSMLSMSQGVMTMSNLCQMCEGEDATVLEFCDDCYEEMVAESNLADRSFNEYWENDDE